MTFSEITKPFGDEFTAESFKAVRKHLKMTQKELSDVLFVSEKTISRYENGHYDVPTPIFMLLAAIVDKEEVSCLRSDHYMRFHTAESIVNSYDRVIFVEVELMAQWAATCVFAVGIDKVGDKVRITSHQAGDTIEMRGQYSWADMFSELPIENYNDDKKLVTEALSWFVSSVDKACTIQGTDHMINFDIKKTEAKDTCEDCLVSCDKS